jgi:hypothetical protein
MDNKIVVLKGLAEDMDKMPIFSPQTNING